jgi:hypothetical protein
MPVARESVVAGTGHGDWLADQVQLSERGHVVHEILLSRGDLWRIEALDLRYEWLALDDRT